MNPDIVWAIGCIGVLITFIMIFAGAAESNRSS